MIWTAFAGTYLYPLFYKPLVRTGQQVHDIYGLCNKYLIISISFDGTIQLLYEIEWIVKIWREPRYVVNITLLYIEIMYA